MADAVESPFEAQLSALIERLSPSARTALARSIAAQLRRTQSARIAAQRNPDGSEFEPRKPQLRHRKKNLRAVMFAKLRTNAYLKTKANADGAVVAFSREVERIARVHQLGLRDRINRTGKLEADYPARKLLGLSPLDKELLHALITLHLER